MNSNPLPTPLAAYFATDRSGGSQRLVACFSRDAAVHDEGGEYRGHAAIEAWHREAQRKYRYTTEPLAATLASSGDRATLRVRLSGSFPGSPTEVGFAFTLADGLIATLKIG